MLCLSKMIMKEILFLLYIINSVLGVTLPSIEWSKFNVELVFIFNMYMFYFKIYTIYYSVTEFKSCIHLV